MSTEEELKWLTKRYSWRYIPFRYQAMVATITAGFLYFNAFSVLFSAQNGAGGACGSIARPVYENGDIGWFSLSMFSPNSDLNCPRFITVQWWELFATFGALAICGLVMRRAIRREDTKSGEGPEPAVEKTEHKRPWWKNPYDA